jgi:hypothetical protein
MRMDEIKEGIMYHNGKGLLRIVVQAPKQGEFGEVTYRKYGSEKLHRCWISTFASWAKGTVQEAELSFSLKCSCGTEMDGFFGSVDSEETLHCDCGNVWKIQRPTNK